MNAVSRHICSSRQVTIGLGAGDPRLLDRREFLWRFGGGLGGIALIHLLGRSGLLAGCARRESFTCAWRAAPPTWKHSITNRN